jgi:hypothetical protein
MLSFGSIARFWLTSWFRDGVDGGEATSRSLRLEGRAAGEGRSRGRCCQVGRPLIPNSTALCPLGGEKPCSQGEAPKARGDAGRGLDPGPAVGGGVRRGFRG